MKQPTKFVLYAVIDTENNDEIVAVALSRQKARYTISEDLSFTTLDGPHPLRYRVRRAKGVLFDS